MSETEKKLLLISETRGIRVPQNNIDVNKRDDGENDWWASDSRSSTGSYYSDSESSVAEWESEISPLGEVFYIESLADSVKSEEKSLEDQNKLQPSEFTRRRSTRANKLMRFIKRKESNRCSVRNKKLNNISEDLENIPETQNKDLLERKFPVAEIYEIMLSVDPERRHKLGRRASMCEVYLGIIPGVSTDNMNILVEGFIPDGEAIKNECIKEGDYLCSINSRNVTPANLDAILSNITAPVNVTLEFQRVTTNKDRTEDISITNSRKQSLLVRRLIDQNMSKSYMEEFLKHPISIIFLKTTGLTEAGPESQDILYEFPRSEGRIEQSILFLTRGAFVTLNHMLSDVLGSRPISSTVRFEKEEVHITYTARDDNLLLIALPDSCCNEYEAAELSAEIVRILEFTNESLTKCFTTPENHLSLDHLFFLFCQRVLLKKSCTDKNDLAQLNKNFDNIAQECEFETMLPAAQMIRLSRDAQIQIDAALNEMEAMDYRDWNEDPMDCQRLYTIIGSCLYHKSYLVGSHLPHDNLIQVHAFLRQYGLLNLVTRELVKSLIVWKKVFPTLFEEEIVGTTDGSLFQKQWFLLIVGYNHDLLAVLLESGGCTAKLEETVGPDVFYVEEAQETLKHIQKIGISTLTEKWIMANARPEIVLPEEQSATKQPASIAENILGFIKSSEAQSCSTKPSYSSPNKKAQEVTPSSKRRSPEENTVASGSMYSLQTSEDSLSQGTGAVSELSDEAAPILGRRAIREKISITSKYSDESDSDFDLYRSDRQINNMDISDIRENLLHQAEYIRPKVLTTGDKNYLFHYVHLDLFEGILISSTIDRYVTKNAELLTKFSKCAHVIHRLLQNSVRYKKMLNQDTDKSVINKNLVAIKEHGVLFDWNNTTYWVLGRMYSNSQAKEMYVCYQDSAPQNLIEMAFKLNSMQ